MCKRLRRALKRLPFNVTAAAVGIIGIDYALSASSSYCPLWYKISAILCAGIFLALLDLANSDKSVGLWRSVLLMLLALCAAVFWPLSLLVVIVAVLFLWFFR